MRILVTGSSGHLGEAIVRTLQASNHEVLGLDIQPSPFTHELGSITDRDCLACCMAGVDAVIHTATLHKPHVATHSKQAFIDTNVSGTLGLLEAAVAQRVRAFVFTSTTSAFGRALVPEPGAPAAWVTEELAPVPRNIYGVTKVAAENLCELFYRKHGLPCLVLRTSRFFPEEDDSQAVRESFDQLNVKVNEFLARRVDIEDVVDAHLRALEKAPEIGFGRYIISATTPFTRSDMAQLRNDAAAVLKKHVPDFEALFRARGWKPFPGLDRVYVNAKARRELGWLPKYDFQTVLEQLACGQRPGSPLAHLVGSKGYHDEVFADGPFPVED